MKRQFLFALACVTLGLCTMGCESNSSDIEPITPSDIHLFSVAENQQVLFSEGNLQYQPSTKTWRFAENQYDAIGEANNTISETSADWIDLFGWGTGSNPTLTSKDHTDYHVFADWGNNVIGNSPKNTWRTLSSEEWEFLLNKRPSAQMLAGTAKVNDINGLIILPDKYWVSVDSVTYGLMLDGIRFQPGIYDTSSDKFRPTQQSFTLEQWNTLEALGAIFLPATSYRISQNVYYLETLGSYWTSTNYNDNSARCLYFHSDKANIGHSLRISSFAVRLVKDL